MFTVIDAHGTASTPVDESEKKWRRLATLHASNYHNLKQHCEYIESRGNGQEPSACCGNIIPNSSSSDDEEAAKKKLRGAYMMLKPTMLKDANLVKANLQKHGFKLWPLLHAARFLRGAAPRLFLRTR